MRHLKLITILAALLLNSTLMSQTSDSLNLVLKRAAEVGLIQEKDFEDIRKYVLEQSKFQQPGFKNMRENAVIYWISKELQYDDKELQLDSIQACGDLSRLKTAGLISPIVEAKVQHFFLSSAPVTNRRALLSSAAMYNRMERLLYGSGFQQFLNTLSQKTKVNQVAADQLLSKIKQHEDLTDADLMDYLPMPATRLPTAQTAAAFAEYYQRLAMLAPELNSIKIDIKEHKNGLSVHFKVLDKAYEQTIIFAQKRADFQPGGNYLRSIYESIPFFVFNDALSDLGSDKRFVMGGSWAGMFWHKPQPNRVFLMTLAEFNAIQSILKQDQFNAQYLLTFYPEQFPETPSPYNAWIQKWQQNNLITSEEALGSRVLLEHLETDKSAIFPGISSNVSNELVALTFIKSSYSSRQESQMQVKTEVFKQAVTEYFQKLVAAGIVSEALAETFNAQISKGISNSQQFPPDCWTLLWALIRISNEQVVQSNDIQILIETAKQRGIFSPQCTPADLMSLSTFLENGLNPMFQRYQTPVLKSFSDTLVFRQAVRSFFDTLKIWFPAAKFDSLQFYVTMDTSEPKVPIYGVRWTQKDKLSTQQILEYKQISDYYNDAPYFFEECWEHIETSMQHSCSNIRRLVNGQSLEPLGFLSEGAYTTEQVGFTLVLAPHEVVVWLRSQYKVLKTLPFHIQGWN